MSTPICSTLGSMAEQRYRRLLTAVRHHVTAATDVLVLYRDFGVTGSDPCVPAAINLAGGPLAVIRKAIGQRHRCRS